MRGWITQKLVNLKEKNLTEMIKEKTKQFFEKTKQNRQTSKKSTQEHTDMRTGKAVSPQMQRTQDAREHKMLANGACNLMPNDHI